MANQTTKRDFNAEAAAWDEKPARVKLASELADAILEAARPTGAGRALDFGCGTGLVTLALAPHVGAITGADTSEGMLAVLEAKAAKAGATNVSVKQLGPDGSGLPEGPFDLIASAMTLHHVPDPAAAIKDLAALAAPRAKLCLADLEPDDGKFHEDNTGVFHFGFAADDVRSMFTAAGLQNVRVAAVTHVHRPAPDNPERKFAVFLAVGEKP